MRKERKGVVRRRGEERSKEENRGDERTRWEQRAEGEEETAVTLRLLHIDGGMCAESFLDMCKKKPTMSTKLSQGSLFAVLSHTCWRFF